MLDEVRFLRLPASQVGLQLKRLIDESLASDSLAKPLLVLLLSPQRHSHPDVRRFSQLLHNCLINLHVFLEARVIEHINFAEFDGRDSRDALNGGKEGREGECGASS